MSNVEEKGLVPALRFPEFKEYETWAKYKLIDVADKKIKWSFIGGPFGSNLKSSDYVGNGIRIIQLQNIGDAKFNEKYKVFTHKEKADELLANNIYPGDIILSKMGDPVGRACLVPDTHDRYVMCSDGIRLVVDESLHCKYFIYSLINDPKFRSTIEENSTGSTRKRIGLDNLKNLPMYLPLKKEQQKIADCLSSLDELITAHNQKLDALKSHKKGLMQQLFPAEGETVPKLRFAGFKGEWSVGELKDLCKMQAGKFVRASDIFENKNNDLYPCYGGNGLRGYTKTYTNEGEYSLIGRQGALCGNVTFAKSKFHATEHAIVATPKKGVSPDWLHHKLIHLNLNRYAIGQAQPGLSVNNLDKVAIKIPKTKIEQQKIADFLSSIDNLITTQKQKIESLKAHKKGLMQQLFPNMDEVRI